MIVMINGSFGVGKTTVAKRLATSIPNCLLYDPEEIAILRSIIPEQVKKPHENTDDFQDLQLWRELTVDVARSVQATYHRALIVPMTISNKSYFRYIFEGFKKSDAHVYHFCLVADERTISERLRTRGEIEGNWCFQQVARCVEAFNNELFGEHIQTDSMEVDEIVNYIAQKITHGQ